MFGENESIELLREIRHFLSEINDKLDTISDSLDEIKGDGVYNIEDLHSELVDIKTVLGG